MPHEWLTESELATIGLVVVESANLELRVEVLLALLLKLSLKQGSAVFGKGMLDSKLSTLANVAEIELAEKPELLKELKDLISEIRDNNDLRTTVVHGIWVNTDAFGAEGMLLFRPMEEPEAQKFTRHANKMKKVKISVAKELGKKIKDTDTKLAALMRKILPAKP